ncbi:amidase [Falsiroseomonas oryzae]|uniref:amidase n=1 Tax=Falsiroseomonas oryzae TaxID=2766473 RepID=UPI0022EA1B23|nr:amidase [Roseomonas sp. MO-31]
MPLPTIAQAANDLADGRTASVVLVEEALSRIGDPTGEGARAFVEVQAGSAMAAARAMDDLRAAGRPPSPWAGIPISIKDLYDQTGHVTRGGSAALSGADPALVTAPSVARLERAGFVVLGRTNMSEFAFSGLGVNPHFGTPRSPWDRATGRLPGGSSSGAAVATVDGMGFAGLGSDTGGSCRIPAALCGIVGWKPTASRVPLAGTLPLSFTLDSLGPLARSVACCALIDSLMAGEEPWSPGLPLPVAGLKLGVLQGYVTQDWDKDVTAAFEAALSRLSAAGVRIERLDLPELAEIPAVNATGGFAASEAWAWHRELIAAKREHYDPRILRRIMRGERMSAADYIILTQARARIIAAIAPRTAHLDAVVTPTCPLVPPAIAEVEDETEYNRINLLLLRNTSVANFLDRCAISLPCHRPGDAPVGFMLMGERMGDARLLAVAQAVEGVLRS